MGSAPLPPVLTALSFLDLWLGHHRVGFSFPSVPPPGSLSLPIEPLRSFSLDVSLPLFSSSALAKGQRRFLGLQTHSPCSGWSLGYPAARRSLDSRSGGQPPARFLGLSSSSSSPSPFPHLCVLTITSQKPTHAKVLVGSALGGTPTMTAYILSISRISYPFLSLIRPSFLMDSFRTSYRPSLSVLCALP